MYITLVILIDMLPKYHPFVAVWAIFFIYVHLLIYLFCELILNKEIIKLKSDAWGFLLCLTPMVLRGLAWRVPKICQCCFLGMQLSQARETLREVVI